MRSLLATLAAAFCLTLLPSTAHAVEETPMGDTRAGNYYTNGSCRLAEVENMYYRRIFGPDDTISRREVQARLPELKDLARQYARAEYAWARHLLNPPAPWPADVAGPAEHLADRNLKFGSLVNEMRYVRGDQGWIRLNQRQNDFNFYNYAAQVRARLDLPRSGGC